jgi:hypothetical protein
LEESQQDWGDNVKGLFGLSNNLLLDD